jgi:pyrophosphatase PpaX
VLITPEDTDRHKPEPEPALAALQRLGAPPREALFIGDSSFDIECGSRAGIDTALVTWSHNDTGAFPVKPTWYIDDMRDCCSW